jgi:hypothetical protein
MRSIIPLLLSVVFATTTFASLGSFNVKGKVERFDGKTVVIEIAGEQYQFDRKKLGKQFTSLKKGDVVEIAVDKKAKDEAKLNQSTEKK